MANEYNPQQIADIARAYHEFAAAAEKTIMDVKSDMHNVLKRRSLYKFLAESVSQYESKIPEEVRKSLDEDVKGLLAKLEI